MLSFGENEKILNLLNKYGKDILNSDSFKSEMRYIQHGTISCYEHSMAVAYMSISIALRQKKYVDMRSLVRGALLHDYFLYDWHEKKPEHMIHGFTHPGKAHAQARRDFDLKHVESDMIKHHMFPLTPMPPKTREGALLCLADKLCATSETIRGRMPYRV